MARARDGRIPHAGRESGGPIGPARRLRRWLARELRQLRPVVEAEAAVHQTDRYRKHFTTFQHSCLLVFHGLSRLPSLRQSYAAFGLCPGLLALSGLGPDEAEPGADEVEPGALGVSYSQYAASNTSRPPEAMAHLFFTLLARARHLDARRGPGLPPPELCLLDTTFFRVCLKLAPWLGGNGGSDRVSAVRVQVEYTPALDLPEHVLVGTTRTNDCRGLDEAILDDPVRLAELAGRTLIFDLGFYSHQRMARLLAADVHVVTRRQQQATVTVLEDRPVQLVLPGVDPASRILVQADQRVQVGSPNNRRGAVLPNLRLVTATVAPTPAAARQDRPPVTYAVLTDRWDLSPAEVIQCYLWRWQIELFFRWLKHVIHAQRLLGYSRPAIEGTVWLALVVHLLCLLAAQALGSQRRSPAVLAQLPFLLARCSFEDLDYPPPPAYRQLPLPALGNAMTSAP